MHKEQIEQITRQVGTEDASRLINKLESLGVGENVILSEEYISIPKSLVKDVASFQQELSFLSKAGRLYEILEENGRIIIDIVKCSDVPLSWYSLPSDIFLAGDSFQNSSFREQDSSWGIYEEHIQLPSISLGSKVLDVGAGSGLLSKKIKDVLGCDAGQSHEKQLTKSKNFF